MSDHQQVGDDAWVGDHQPGSHHKIVRTRTGALAMRDDSAGEVMHPGVGPLVEAERLYVGQSRIGERLRQSDAPAMVLFDVGMGAGSNAAAAILESERAPARAARLVVISFERDLDALRTALTAPAAFGLNGTAEQGARTLLREGQFHTARTSWQLAKGDLLNTLPLQAIATADVVFWDPFSPRINAELWTVGAFATLRRAAAPRCTLFTYSASTAVRIALVLAGWTVGVGAGIGDKAATTAAAIDPADLALPLDHRWLHRLSLPDVPLPSDAPADVVQQVAAAPQFALTARAPDGTSPTPGSR